MTTTDECAVDKPLKISWSSLRVHETCKQKHYLSKIQKLPTVENLRVFLPGNVTDRAVRWWLSPGHTPQLGEMADRVEQILAEQLQEIKEAKSRFAWRSPNDQKTVLEECKQAVTLLEPIITKMVLPYEYEPDYRFSVELLTPHPLGGMGRIILNGILDIRVIDLDRFVRIYDVKHTKNESYWRQTIGQLGFYDLATMIETSRVVADCALLQPLCVEKIRRYQPSAESRAQLLQRIVGMANDIWRRDYSPTSHSDSCTYCDVKHACIKYATKVDTRGQRRIAF